ncbi:MAG: hypothetical protein V1726_06300, partial [Methanobacteriota archaeon]
MNGMEKDDKINEFFMNKLITSTKTRSVYRCNIQSYFKIINKDMETYIPTNGTWKSLTEQQKEGYIEQYNNDLKRVYFLQEKERRPLLSRATYFNSVRQFMVPNNKELKELEFWENFRQRLRGAEPAGDNYVPNQNDIKNVLAHADTVGRAMFLMMASTGRRIEEILALFPSDVHLDSSPASLSVTKGYDPTKPDKTKPTTKSKSKTLCFMSDEAKDAYIAWMKERDSYL